MSRIEELPDDLNGALDLNATHPAPKSPASTGMPLDLPANALPFPVKTTPPSPVPPSSQQPSAAMPPAMAASKSYTADELLTLLNRTPLFMTELDETDGAGGENVELEALKALAHEGTRADIAEALRQQGNEQARARRWGDAREFYARALAALRGEPAAEEREREEAEDEARRGLEEACAVNRALCNLEMKNYRACNLDCAAAVRLNPRNVKAYYRSGQASLAVDRLDAAADACARALLVKPANAPVRALADRVAARRATLAEAERARAARARREQVEAATLRRALAERHIAVQATSGAAPPDVEDARVRLADPLDAASALAVPVLLLYPTRAQSDVVKAFGEHECLLDHLEYIFPCPWDESGGEDFAAGTVECYMDTAAGGLVKVGKRMPLLKVLGGGKVRIVDGLCKIYVVPKKEVEAWIAEVKRRRVG